MRDLDPVLIQSAAARHGLPPVLITAIIARESAGNPWAWNPEPKYKWFWDVRRNRAFRAISSAEIDSKTTPSDFPCLAGDRDQEWWAQQASWGLMQIMGAVARECGCTLPYLPQLCDPDEGIEYGCRHLASLKGRYLQGHGWDGVIASYNAGSPRRVADGGPFVNQKYVDAVIQNLGGAPL